MPRPVLCTVLLLLAAVCLQLAACSASDPPTVPASSLMTPGKTPDTVRWTFAPRALALHIKADPNMNYEDEQAHTLRLCLYQLEKPDAFNELAATSEGLARLMLCQRFDPSVKDLHSQIIQPGLLDSQVLDRAEGARHVAVVAGYSHLEPGLVSRTWAIPVALYEDGSLFWKETYYYPGPLEMVLLLGPSSLQRLNDSDTEN